MTDSGAEQTKKATFVRNIEKVYATIQSDSYKLPFTQEEIAMRLYYLHLITGEVAEADEKNIDGSSNLEIDFSIDAPLTRLEALVIAIRLMGAEDEALTQNYAHDFADVPQWGSPYVGYACHMRIPGFSAADISKMRSIELESGEYLTDEFYFRPDDPISSNAFIDYLQYTLKYSQPSKADNSLSLFKYVKKNKITRGEAFEYVFRTLRSKINSKTITLSESYVESGRISYEDAIFLIWTDDNKETEQYIKNAGYALEETIPNGYYTIVNENGKYLNVNSTGANTDYEGIGVSLYNGTGDITQAFRLERTERGTYLVYSAASRGGFSRLIGINTRAYASCAGLYAPTSSYAKEFYIKSSYSENSQEKTWYMIPYESAHSISAVCNVLSASESSSGLALSEIQADSGFNQLWTIQKTDVVIDDGVESAIFPAIYLHITQGAYGEYSHMEQNAIDCVSVGRFFAPFTAEIKRIDNTEGGNNIVVIESVSMVKFADGTKDYMTVAFLHDDDISDLSVGQILHQGEGFYDMGTAGNATGDHVHISCYRGKYDPMSCSITTGGINVEEAFFVIGDTKVKDTGGIEWVYKK